MLAEERQIAIDNRAGGRTNKVGGVHAVQRAAAKALAEFQRAHGMVGRSDMSELTDVQSQHEGFGGVLNESRAGYERVSPSRAMAESGRDMLADIRFSEHLEEGKRKRALEIEGEERQRARVQRSDHPAV